MVQQHFANCSLCFHVTQDQRFPFQSDSSASSSLPCPLLLHLVERPPKSVVRGACWSQAFEPNSRVIISALQQQLCTYSGFLKGLWGIVS